MRFSALCLPFIGIVYFYRSIVLLIHFPLFIVLKPKQCVRRSFASHIQAVTSIYCVDRSHICCRIATISQILQFFVSVWRSLARFPWDYGKHYKHKNGCICSLCTLSNGLSRFQRNFSIHHIFVTFFPLKSNFSGI